MNRQILPVLGERFDRLDALTACPQAVFSPEVLQIQQSCLKNRLYPSGFVVRGSGVLLAPLLEVSRHR